MLWVFILIDPLPLPYEAVRLGIVINSCLETDFLALKFMPELVGFLEVSATTGTLHVHVAENIKLEGGKIYCLHYDCKMIATLDCHRIAGVLRWVLCIALSCVTSCASKLMNEITWPRQLAIWLAGRTGLENETCTCMICMQENSGRFCYVCSMVQVSTSTCVAVWFLQLQ